MRVLFSSLEELMFITPETRAAAPSSSRVTSESMVSGEAPGKKAFTDTTGRSTSGSSRTSIANSAAIPPMATKRLSTSTSQGLRTPSSGKPLLIGMSDSAIVGGVQIVTKRFECHARANRLNPFHDHGFALG